MRRSLAGISLLLCPMLALAELDLERLRDLVRAGDAQEAYSLGSDYVDERAGEVGFDFYYGIAAIDSGHVDEGVFALERVLMQRPGFDRARLEYARGLFLLEDDRRAREEFERVLAGDPPAAVAERVRQYLAAMDRRADRYETTVTGYVGAEIGSDDNVNRAPSADSIDLGFATLQLAPSSQERDDSFVSLNGGVTVSHPLRPGLNVVASADGDLRRHADEDEFDTRQLGASGGLRWSSGAHGLTALLRVDDLAVDGDGYQRSSGLQAGYRYQASRALTWFAQANLAELRYDEQEVLDSSLQLFAVGVSRAGSGSWNPRVRFSLLAGQESADGSSDAARGLAERDIVGLTTRIGLTPAPEWALGASFAYRLSDYAARAPLFPAARDEAYSSADLTLDWHPDPHWRVGPHVRYVSNDSNVELYDYDRAVLGVRARYSFF